METRELSLVSFGIADPRGRGKGEGPGERVESVIHQNKSSAFVLGHGKGSAHTCIADRKEKWALITAGRLNSCMFAGAIEYSIMETPGRGRFCAPNNLNPGAAI